MMKHIKKYNEILDPMGKWVDDSEGTSAGKEISNVGFLETDLLSTMVISDDNKGTLYLFNWGTYGRIDKYFTQLENEDDYSDIEDWLSDILRDYQYDVFPTVTKIEPISKDGLDLEILKKYPEGEIGKNVIKIDFTFSTENISESLNDSFFFSQDSSSHWYMIPTSLRRRWNELSSKDEDDYDNNDLIDSEFGQYRTGGGIENIQFENPKKE